VNPSSEFIASRVMQRKYLDGSNAMPDDQPRVHRPSRVELEDQIGHSRELIRRSIEILAQGRATDTLLGRKSQETCQDGDYPRA
jgi:hypothetical protein